MSITIDLAKLSRNVLDGDVKRPIYKAIYLSRDLNRFIIYNLIKPDVFLYIIRHDPSIRDPVLDDSYNFLLDHFRVIEESDFDSLNLQIEKIKLNGYKPIEKPLVFVILKMGSQIVDNVCLMIYQRLKGKGYNVIVSTNIITENDKFRFCYIPIPLSSWTDVDLDYIAFVNDSYDRRLVENSNTRWHLSVESLDHYDKICQNRGVLFPISIDGSWKSILKDNIVRDIDILYLGKRDSKILNLLSRFNLRFLETSNNIDRDLMFKRSKIVINVIDDDLNYLSMIQSIENKCLFLTGPSSEKHPLSEIVIFFTIENLTETVSSYLEDHDKRLSKADEAYQFFDEIETDLDLKIDPPDRSVSLDSLKLIGYNTLNKLVVNRQTLNRLLVDYFI